MPEHSNPIAEAQDSIIGKLRNFRPEDRKRFLNVILPCMFCRFCGGLEPCSRCREHRDNIHRLLHSVVKHLPSDVRPWGEREEGEHPDCSCGCKHFVVLQVLPGDWGVCTNPKSPRCGLLTFEHQGCLQFEAGNEPEDIDF